MTLRCDADRLEVLPTHCRLVICVFFFLLEHPRRPPRFRRSLSSHAPWPDEPPQDTEEGNKRVAIWHCPRCTLCCSTRKTPNKIQFIDPTNTSLDRMAPATCRLLHPLPLTSHSSLRHTKRTHGHTRCGQKRTHNKRVSKNSSCDGHCRQINMYLFARQLVLHAVCDFRESLMF